MKKLFTLTLIALFLSAGFYSCKKYDEGPALSLRSKTKRLSQVWKLNTATDVGSKTDVTTSILGVNKDKTYGYTFKEDGSYEKDNNGKTYTGKWNFDDKKDNISLLQDNVPEPEIFKIIKLKNEELWVQQTVSSQTTEYHYIPK